MEGKFSLTINLSNEAMSEPEDVIKVLEQAAHHLFEEGLSSDPHLIKDDNGNQVGHFAFIEEVEPGKFKADTFYRSVFSLLGEQSVMGEDEAGVIFISGLRESGGFAGRPGYLEVIPEPED